MAPVIIVEERYASISICDLPLVLVFSLHISNLWFYSLQGTGTLSDALNR